ncbi:protein FAM110B-like [Mytilus californianus]|uniref:protein FAM110B-like n=1 Tax=Mytilus californianus TaxID=6549 RepID=UPI0022468153|nr:protein FAM110B-like [Mytilus californianus]XP_052098664.1 protein FAM110B-like [Mytilus californianus]XP_052098666.1 protein FAM110B-like [Mytilus californianus]XP_052098673.1 protein FAM110B-like [Mytilus californianus]
MSELLCVKVVEQISKLIMSIAITSISNTPDKIINKGADFFRRNSSNRGLFDRRRKSAVELLEASKGEYVKSVSVLKQKQELKHPENLHVSTRPKSIVLGAEPRSKSDLGLSPSDNSPKSSLEDQSTENDIKSSNSLSENRDSPVTQELCRKVSLGKLSGNMAASPQSTESKVTELDKRKPLSKSKDFLSPNAFQSLSTSVTVLVEKRCNAATDKSANENKEMVVRRKKKPLHRSQSDLSGRWSRNSSDYSDLSSRVSRTSTEVERFFNEMGLESSILERMRHKFQIMHVNDEELFESISSIDSAERSTCSEASIGDKEKDKELKERNSVQTSIVEKNARIIKWLCNVKKARTNPRCEAQSPQTKKE